LPLASFLRYFNINLFFANECEAVLGQAGTSLITIVNRKILDYITARGKRKNKTLPERICPNDWQDKDFSSRDNEILKLVLQCSASDPPE
jgi:vacuolar protein sorting-associated protein 54